MALAAANLPESDFLVAALEYADQGLAVFPLWPQKKKPRTTHSFKDASAEPEQIEQWWNKWPSANIGIRLPADLLVLDLDSREVMKRLESEGRLLPETATVRTGRGFHYWYRVQTPVRNRTRLLEHVDVKTAGGYAIVPPSIHPSGRSYSWIAPLETGIAAAPEWLVELLTEPQKRTSGKPLAKPERIWAERISETVGEGRRNQSLAKIAGYYFHHLPAEAAAEAAFCWAYTRLRPQLPETEVRSTISSIARCELR